MNHIKRCMENKLLDVRIELTNYHAPDDGSTSIGAMVRDAYTGKVLVELSWYYDFDELMADLNERMSAI